MFENTGILDLRAATSTSSPKQAPYEPAVMGTDLRELLLLGCVKRAGWGQAVPSISFVDGCVRAGQLGFVGVVEGHALDRSRDVFVAPGRRAHELADDWPCEDECGEASSRGPQPESGDAPRLEAWQVAAHHGVLGQRGRVVVDPCAIYVTSIRDWLLAVIPRCGTPEMSTLLLQLVEHGSDGPAVLLAPEKIAALVPLADRVLSGNGTAVGLVEPEKTVLRHVLLHELGHHFYPGADDAPVDLSEALADWFAYSWSSPAERRLMLSLSRTLPRPYRMYRGLEALHAASRNHGPDPLGLLDAATVREIERLAFAGALCRDDVELPGLDELRRFFQGGGFADATLDDLRRVAVAIHKELSASEPGVLAVEVLADRMGKLLFSWAQKPAGGNRGWRDAAACARVRGESIWGWQLVAAASPAVGREAALFTSALRGGGCLVTWS